MITSIPKSWGYQIIHPIIEKGACWSFQAWKMLRKCVRYKSHVATKLTKMTQKIHPNLLDFTSHPQSEALCSCQAWRLFLRLPTVMATTPMVSETARERGRTQLTWKAQLLSSHPVAKDEEKSGGTKWGGWRNYSTPFSRLWEDQYINSSPNPQQLFFLKGNHSGEGHGEIEFHICSSTEKRQAWCWCREITDFPTRDSQRLGNLIESGVELNDGKQWKSLFFPTESWGEREECHPFPLFPNNVLKFVVNKTQKTHPNSRFKWAQSSRTKANQGNSLLHHEILKQPVFSNGSLFDGTNKCFIRHGFGIIPN